MARVIVPPGMVPGPPGYQFAFKGPGLCDIGVNRKAMPTAWVEVVITPISGAGGGKVTPDASGRLLHCLWTFARPTTEIGKRVKNVPSWYPAGFTSTDPIMVETDPMTGWLGNDVTLGFVGGTVGDLYDVTVTEKIPRDVLDKSRQVDVYEDVFEFALTSVFLLARYVDFPAAPPYHHSFQIVQGNAQILTPGGAVPLGSTPFKRPIPLNLGQYQVQAGAFQSTGAI